MQMLCLPFLPLRSSAGRSLGLALAVTLAWPLGSWATPPSAAQSALPLAASSTEAPLSWPVASTPALALQQLVSQWLGSRYKLDPAAVVLAPLDARLQIKPCQSGLTLDLPFANAQTVRVRCEQPVWQLYMRSTTARQSPAPAAETPAAAPEVQAQTRQVVVSTGLLQRGTRLTEAHLKQVELPVKGLPTQVIEQLSDALQAEVVRDLMPGTPLRSQDIRPALLVRRGQMVMISIGLGSGMQVQARLEALQDGRMGEQIRLKNRESGRQISAVVTGLNTAQAL
jgi:flagella basal body P-ring formation protein FlgA